MSAFETASAPCGSWLSEVSEPCKGRSFTRIGPTNGTCGTCGCSRAVQPDAPSLVDLAHAAEQAIARYIDVADKACAAVGSEGDVRRGIGEARYDAFRAVEVLWIHSGWPSGSAASLRALHDIRALLGAGIARPEWGLRVVQVATEAQARKDSTT